MLGTILNGLGALQNLAQFLKACFAAGTPLLTPDGSKPIEDFRVGDWVLSRSEDDPEGPLVAKRVVNVFHNYSPLLEIHLGGQVIRTTAEHPFWVVGRGWVAGHQIVPGDLLLGADGEQTAVEAIDGPKEPALVYNLEIEEYHTYWVGSGPWGFSVWSHNLDCSEWAAAHMQQNGGEMLWLKPLLPHWLTGKLPGDPAQTGYAYHAFNSLGGKLFDEFHPQGIPLSEWLAQYCSPSLNPFMSEAEFPLYYALDNIPHPFSIVK